MQKQGYLYFVHNKKRMYHSIESIKKDLDNGTFNPNQESEKEKIKKEEQKRLF